MEEAKLEQPERHDQADQDNKQYPPTKQVIPAMMSLYMVVFLIALVSGSTRTIEYC